ncbi:hypothetical protein [Paenibacillus montanisoli]|uniref:hypothetical protein n=1 Tax=Paenibacillus montanisoli TaxID=2081970 RepID=UPI0014023E02|nr:hypothetical protein [Paenibacillus montanisoli]
MGAYRAVAETAAPHCALRDGAMLSVVQLRQGCGLTRKGSGPKTCRASSTSAANEPY